MFKWPNKTHAEIHVGLKSVYRPHQPPAILTKIGMSRQIWVKLKYQIQRKSVMSVALIHAYGRTDSAILGHFATMSRQIETKCVQPPFDTLIQQSASFPRFGLRITSVTELQNWRLSAYCIYCKYSITVQRGLCLRFSPSIVKAVNRWLMPI